MYEDLNPDQINLNPDSVRSFTEKLREKSGSELLKIITRYISYQPETVEAALIVSVDQGLISYNLKVLLSKQMMTNFIAHSKHIKATRWEINKERDLKTLSVLKNKKLLRKLYSINRRTLQKSALQ
jgi:hypothetical protein